MVWRDEDTGVFNRGARRQTSSAAFVDVVGGRLHWFQADRTIDAVSWINEREVHFLLERRHVAALNTNPSLQFTLSGDFVLADVEGDRPGGFDYLKELSPGRLASSGLRNINIFNERLIVTSRGTGNIVEFVAGQPSSTQVNLFRVAGATAVKASDGDWTLAFDGGEGRGERWISDAASGDIVGTYHANTVAWADPNKPKLRLGGIVKDVSAQDGNVAILVGSTNGSLTLAVARGQEIVSETEVCSGGETARAPHPLDMFGEDIPGSAVLFPGSNPSRLIIRLHGGPMGSLHAEFPSVVSRIVASQTAYDLVEIDLPGSAGYVALDADRTALTVGMLSGAVFDIARWIETRGYSEVIIIGESFGAPASMAISRELSSPKISVILVAPLSEIDSEHGIDGKPLEQGSVQTRFEMALFGSRVNREHLADWVRQQFDATSCIAGEVTILRGDDDPLAWGKSYVDQCPSARAKSYLGRNHRSLLEDPEFRRDLVELLQTITVVTP